MGGVEEEVARDGPRLVLALVGVERAHEVEELDRHRGGAHQDVALAGDRDRALLGVLLGLEIAADVALGRLEDRGEGLGNLDRAKAG